MVQVKPASVVDLLATSAGNLVSSSSLSISRFNASQSTCHEVITVANWMWAKLGWRDKASAAPFVMPDRYLISKLYPKSLHAHF